MKLLVALYFCISTFAGSIEIMSYNVENFFDVTHDKDKEDWTFLPKNTPGKNQACKKMGSKHRKKECFDTDWTLNKLNIKLSQVRDVILKERKVLPNILALVEIENQNVVSMLAKELGYKFFHTSDSPDSRGIDLGILYNEDESLQFISKKEHILKDDYFKKKASRNIFEVEFLLNKKDKLYIFVNHWPSLSNPDDSRVVAATVLKERILEIQKLDKDALVVSLGDFNTIDKLKKIGNKHPFYDVLLAGDAVVDLSEIAKNNENPPGTYYYFRGREWNKLDRFFLSKNLVDNKLPDADLKSYQIYAPEFITQQTVNHFEKKKSKFDKEKAYPKRYDHNASDKSKAGYSDHFPIVFKINY